MFHQQERKKVLIGAVIVGICLGIIISLLLWFLVPGPLPVVPGPLPVVPTDHDIFYNVIVCDADDTWTITTSDKKTIKGSGIQSKCDAIYATMENGQFSSERYALCFKPGTYNNIHILLGYSMTVMGLGITPDDVTINGTVDVNNNTNPCIGALDNFWRGIENVHIAIPVASTEAYDCSQAAPFRNNHVSGGTLNLATFEAGCEGDRSLGGFASGGYMADCVIDGDIDFSTQQQFFTRNNTYRQAKNGAWNFLSVGDQGKFANPTITNCIQGKAVFHAVPSTPIMAKKPYVVWKDNQWQLFIGQPQKDVIGPLGTEGGKYIKDFAFVTPDTGIDNMNLLLAQGSSLVLTPGIYTLSSELVVQRPNTVVLGIGFATIVTTSNRPCIRVTNDAIGVRIAGLMLEAGEGNAESLLLVGDTPNGGGNNDNPTFVQDVFGRIGPNFKTRCGAMMTINQRFTIVDHTWLWRADHSQTVDGGLGSGNCVSDNGLVVNGDDVYCYGVFSEHHLKECVLWQGANGRLYFLQCELAYDVADIVGWDYPGLRVTGSGFVASNIGVYTFFSKSQGSTATNPSVTSSCVVPNDAKLSAVCNVFLNADTGAGRMLSIVNGRGPATSASNHDQPMWTSLNSPLCGNL